MLNANRKDWGRHRRLLADQDIKRWYDNIARGSIITADVRLRRLVEIIYRNNKFWCDVDEKECCVHVHFALALPELAELKSK